MCGIRQGSAGKRGLERQNVAPTQEDIAKELGVDITREEKIAKAVRLRKEGRSYRQIGEWLGVDEKTIRNWYKEIPGADNSAPGKTEGDDGKQYPKEMTTPKYGGVLQFQVGHIPQLEG